MQIQIIIDYRSSYFLHYKMKYIGLRKVILIWVIVGHSCCFAVLNQGMQNSIFVAKWWMLANKLKWTKRKFFFLLSVYWWTRLFRYTCVSCRFKVDKRKLWSHHLFRYIVFISWQNIFVVLPFFRFFYTKLISYLVLFCNRLLGLRHISSTIILDA